MSINCVFPPELDDQQIMAYLDDPDTHQETAHHLAQCPHCRENAQSLDQFQKRLGTRLYRSTCPPPAELGEFHLRMLPAPQRLVIAQHLRQCPLCTREIVQLEEFLGDPSPRKGLLQPIKTLLARLSNSEAEAPSASSLPALRGDVKKPAIFTVNGIVITLDVEPGPDEQVAILGQMAAGDQQDQWTGATVELKQPYFTSLITSLDDLGDFTFETVFSGPAQITITSMNGTAVKIEQISFTT